MPEFIEALRTLTFADFLRLLAILTPFIVAIWGAFRWAYGVRLKTLETSLTELRTDFQRNLNRHSLNYAVC
ncbi:hypothetical protein SAMN05216317_1474 [Nitrosomonas eutropha]|nr:hypothetical protein SAMN05216317_1474 [Nitrosomonas eutropha]